MGDLGPEAIKFINFLREAKQQYWQVLPLNPVGNEQGYSPYSSISSMAGNSLLISPEFLVDDGLLTKSEVRKHAEASTSKIDFKKANKIRDILLKKAYDNFSKRKELQAAFELFCRKEASWLNEFALYTALKHHHHENAWFDWPPDFKFRKDAALKSFSNDAQDFIQYVKWVQFIFFKQWHHLKTYANRHNIQLFGDLPFYVSYDSADVWSHPDIFSLDKKGRMLGVAGVPPDYFNSDGQLWGMPTFQWNELKNRGYDWWINRIKKNLEMYDLLRLDHFRAFANYWEVPSTHTTAVRGRWKNGPGGNFFKALQRTFKQLPFVAEDLGDIDQSVHDLRDQFDLPGMKILQFAFNNTMPESSYIPHNFTTEFLVYTGTHDNNTTRGWYRQNTSPIERKNISAYAGKVVTEKNVHEFLMRLAYGSVANTAIIPMQDILGLDERSRMNTPASTKNNWLWRIQTGALTNDLARHLKGLTTLYNR
jgi:4-alpha-glucanotransferase